MDERVDGEFFRGLFELRDLLNDRWRALEPAVPAVLYHYTSAVGAAGILKSAKLWATLAFHLNDEKELIHASQLLKKLIVKRMNAATTREEKLLLAPELHSVDITRPDILQFFIASLSATEDDRVQWELYADRGYGVALGFDGPQLLRLSLSPETKPNFATFTATAKTDRSAGRPVREIFV